VRLGVCSVCQKEFGWDKATGPVPLACSEICEADRRRAYVMDLNHRPETALYRSAWRKRSANRLRGPKSASNKRQHVLRGLDGNRSRMWAKRYGLTRDDYEARLVRQRGACAICGAWDSGTPTGVFCVDHSHATGRVRSLLCRTCNFSLGAFRDNPDRFISASTYLVKHAGIEG
jgi:hypothetical protein